MKTEYPIEEIKKAAAIFRLQLNELENKVESIQEVAKREATSRLSRLDTMISALERDISELENTKGADLATASGLAESIDVEISNLIPEIDALTQGNPTTVSAVFDASLQAVEQAGDAIKKVTSKIPLMK